MAGGRATAYLALALLAAGGLFALPSLYVPGIALALLAAGAFAWVEAAARGARVGSLPGPRTVVEGEPYRLRMTVDWGPIPPPSGELSHPALAEPLELGPRSQGALAAEVRFERWGPRRVEPPLLRVQDPLGLHRRGVKSDAGQQLLVLPRVEPLLAPAEGNGGAPLLRGELGERAGGRSARAIDPEVDGVRPWRPGSPASRIHWPSVARTGELLEKGLVGGADSAPLVVVDRSSEADDRSLVKAVRAAASLCMHLAQAGGCSLLLPGESRPFAIDRELRSWPRAHARLALVDPERPAPAYPPPRAGAIFWVAPGGRLEGRTAGRGGGYLVTPTAIPSARPSFEVAGCRGYALAAIAAAGAGAGDPPRRAGVAR